MASDGEDSDGSVGVALECGVSQDAVLLGGDLSSEGEGDHQVAKISLEGDSMGAHELARAAGRAGTT